MNLTTATTMNVCLTLALVLVLVLASPGLALHCNGEITTIGTGDATFYIDDRTSQQGPINHWFYMESNDIEGLQTGGSTPVYCADAIPGLCAIFDYIDPCTHTNPDTLIL